MLISPLHLGNSDQNKCRETPGCKNRRKLVLFLLLEVCKQRVYSTCALLQSLPLFYAQGDAFLAGLLISVGTIELSYIKENISFEGPDGGTFLLAQVKVLIAFGRGVYDDVSSIWTFGFDFGFFSGFGLLF